MSFQLVINRSAFEMKFVGSTLASPKWAGLAKAAAIKNTGRCGEDIGQESKGGLSVLKSNEGAQDAQGIFVKSFVFFVLLCGLASLEQIDCLNRSSRIF